jgi:hypothetical protein
MNRVLACRSCLALRLQAYLTRRLANRECFRRRAGGPWMRSNGGRHFASPRPRTRTGAATARRQAGVLAPAANVARLVPSVPAAFNVKSQRFAEPQVFSIDACGLQRGDVQKYIRTARVVPDETEAAVGLPHFQSACSHRDLFSLRLQPQLYRPTDQIKLRRLAIFLNGSLSVLALRRTAKVVRFRALAMVSTLFALRTSARSSLSRSGVQGRRGVPVISPSPSTRAPEA